MIRNRDMAAFDHRVKKIQAVNGLGLIATCVALVALLVSVFGNVTQLSSLRTEKEMLLEVLSSQSQHPDNREEGVSFSSVPLNSVLIEWIGARASQSGCDVTAVRPKPPPDEYGSSWVISTRGTYHCMGKLVQAFEQSQHIVQITRLTAIPSRSSRDLQIDVELNMWFAA